jgi:hypothetical protein
LRGCSFGCGFKRSRVQRVQGFVRFCVPLGGTSIAVAPGTTAKDFSELIAWQRADDLEQFVAALVQRPSLARDLDFCSQAADAAASAPRNIAEGFGRFAPAQFANFLRIAIGSEVETKNHIVKAW